MKLFKEIIVVILTGTILISCYLLFKNIDFSNLNKETIIGLILIGFVFIIYLVSLIKSRKAKKELKYREKLFDSLVKNDDTIYIMYNYDKKELIYMTQNVCSILGKTESGEKEALRLLKEVFKHPILSEELRVWNKKSDFVSQMFSYRNSAYQYVRWLKVKIYPVIEKKNRYNIAVISDVTKDHDKQHLLVTQAADIKLREKQLNQITASSYDVELGVNLSIGDAYIRNLNEDFKYFGQAKDGKYDSILNNIIEKCVKEENKKEVYNVLCLQNLNDHVIKGNLEPISVRYQYNIDEVMWLESTAFFTKSNNENLVTILTKDVTENAEYMRKQNVLLQKALNDAKRANQTKSNFLKTVSHEIRTPMNVITGLSSTILEEELSENVRDDVETINSASMNLMDVIDRMLDISKVEAGIIELHEKEYNTPKFFKDLSNYTKESIGKRPIKYHLNLSKDVPNTLYGDPSKIRQMISNLINNSIDNTEKGNIELSVESTINNDKADLTIKVSDTGSGIAKDVLPHIFDKKTGTGLSIVKQLIELFKGNINVESKEGVGTTFTITLSQKIVETEQKEVKNTTIDLTGKKVLVVDDDKLNLKVATRLLKPYNVTVELVESGIECVEFINSNKEYDLILLDQMMPVQDGVTTLHQLKENKDFKIPVVMLTADAIKGKKEEYLNEGFNDYLSKPIERAELDRVLKKYLKKD